MAPVKTEDRSDLIYSPACNTWFKIRLLDNILAVDVKQKG